MSAERAARRGRRPPRSFCRAREGNAVGCVLRRATRRLAQAGLCIGVVTLGACDRSASAPAAFRPESRFGCPDLIGDYRIVDAHEAGVWMPHPGVKDVPDWSSLSIEADPLHRGLRKVLRRDPDLVLREASELRERAPDDYATWREQVRYAMQIEHGTPGRAYGESILREHGPAVEVSQGMIVSDDCDGGWAPVPNPGSDVLLSRGAHGELLMQVKRYTQESSGWSFFGTPVTYPRYDRTEWYRLLPLAPGKPVRIDPAALVTAPPPEARVRAPTIDPELATRELAAEADAFLRRTMSRGVTITLLRATQFDQAALGLAPHAVRMEIAGSFDARADPDPFQQLLRGVKRVDAIELRERSTRGEKRAYARVHFTWHAQESTPR